jgi:hypothetical protein
MRLGIVCKCGSPLILFMAKNINNTRKAKERALNDKIGIIGRVSVDSGRHVKLAF